MSTYTPLATQDEDIEWISRLPSRKSKRWSRVVLYVSLFIFTVILLFTFDILYSNMPQNPFAQLKLDGESSALQSFMNHLFPVGLPNRTDNWENENSKTMHNLISCMETESCGQNQTSIVLMSSEHFAHSIHGSISGEDIWAMSVLLSLREMGYTAIFAPNNYELARTYRLYPDLVKIIILEGSRSKECFRDPKCIKTPTHPLGIPAWKMLSFHFWGGSENPLGHKWTLSPENYASIEPHGNGVDNAYLGYSIERTCMKIPVPTSSERPNQVYVFGKNARYFGGKEYAYPGLSFVPPADPTLDDLGFVAGLREGTPEELKLFPPSIHNLGKLNQVEFYEQLAKSRVLIGIGKPALSPSPYDALCMGVPFINPVLGWDKTDPENRIEWQTQQNGLKYEHPPYVYHVKQGDIKGFWEAVKAAVEHPIERYIVPHMTMNSLKHRLAAIVETDWKSMAEDVLAERKASGRGKLFEI